MTGIDYVYVDSDKYHTNVLSQHNRDHGLPEVTTADPDPTIFFVQKAATFNDTETTSETETERHMRSDRGIDCDDDLHTNDSNHEGDNNETDRNAYFFSLDGFRLDDDFDDINPDDSPDDYPDDGFNDDGFNCATV